MEQLGIIITVGMVAWVIGVIVVCIALCRVSAGCRQWEERNSRRDQ
jgi:hypothetical protein